MAATGTPTPNIGLRIPQGTDPASVDDINYNSNLLDTKLGAVGNESVQDQIDSLNTKITMWIEEIEFNGTIFPTSKPVRGQNQYCVVARNISTGSLYLLWNSASQGGFRHGATISGSDPVTGDKVYVCYPIN